MTSLSQLQQISDITFQVDSPANAANGAGAIYIPDIEVNRDYIGTLDFYIYDLNADTDLYTGEPFLVTQGTTSVSQEGEQFYIYVQRELNLLADGDGSLSFEIQFQDQNNPLQPNFVISESLSLREQLELFEAQKDSSGRTHQKQTHGSLPGEGPGDGTIPSDITGDGSVRGDVEPGDGSVLPRQPDATFSTNPNDPAVEIKLDPGVLPTDKTEEEYLGIVSNEPSFIAPTVNITGLDPSIIQPFIGPLTEEEYLGTQSDGPTVDPLEEARRLEQEREALDALEADSSTPSIDPVDDSSKLSKYVGGDVHVGVNIMYRGIIQGQNGLLYMVPYASDDITVTNIATNRNQKYDITSYGNSGLAKYVGGAIAPNGKIYLGPQQADAPLIIDTNSTPPTFSEVQGYQTFINAQSRGPSYYNNRVYIPSYKSGNEAWLVVNTNTDTAEPSILRPPVPKTDPIFLTRVDYATENSGTALKDYESIQGSVAGNNGKIYGMPYGASRINIVDTVEGTSTWGQDYLTGNAPIDDDPWSRAMVESKTYFSKYKYGALANNGNIYAHGHRARSILKINTSNDSATEIPYPEVIIEAMLDGGSKSVADTAKAASYGSVLGGDGRIYSTPWNIPYLIWIDPKDDTIGYFDISNILDSSGATNGWYTLATAVGNSLYFSPGISHKILEINLDVLIKEYPNVYNPPATQDDGANKPPIPVNQDGSTPEDTDAGDGGAAGDVGAEDGSTPEDTDAGDGGVTGDSGRTHGPKSYTLQIFNNTDSKLNVNGLPLDNKEPNDLFEITSEVNKFSFTLLSFQDLDNIDLTTYRVNITNREMLTEQVARYTIEAEIAEGFTIGSIYITGKLLDPFGTDSKEGINVDDGTNGNTGDSVDGGNTDDKIIDSGKVVDGGTVDGGTVDGGTTGIGPGPTGTPVNIPTPFTNIIPPGGGIPPPFITDTPTEIPPPDIPFTPFTPADCGTPPVVRLGVPPEEDPDFVPPVEVEPVEPPEVFFYPAPVDSFAAPFLSNIDFNTNFTKKEPTPFNFVEEVDPGVVEAPAPSPNVKINLCEEEECSELGF